MSARGEVGGALADLASLIGSRVTAGQAEREHHSHGESYHAPGLPDLVCYPATTDEVAAIVRVSARYGLPVIPFGAGSSLEGHVNATTGGISIDLRDMNRVVRLGVEDLDVTVEAGIRRKALNKALENSGLTFFIDPGADCTIGGMVSTRASGTTAVRYGTMRENVLGLAVVLADGSVIRTGSRARKSASGYDLTRLFVGAEGTLGVITEVTLRLHPLPDAVATAVSSFADMRGAVDTVIATMQAGVSVARIELADAVQMDAINRYSKTDYPVAPTLFFEFHGFSEAQVGDEARFVEGLSSERGGSKWRWATRSEDRARLWQARHDSYFAALALRPGSKALTTDVCVPISRLADCLLETMADHAGAPFPAPIVGHAGDGNFHVLYVLDPESPAELSEAERLSDRMVARALAMGGTSTGEHGVGLGKQKYLAAEHGASLEVMRAIKRTLDPDNRMNPGKCIVHPHAHRARPAARVRQP